METSKWEASRSKFLSPQGLIDGMREANAAMKGSYRLKSTAPYMELMIQYFERVVRAKKEGKTVVCHSTCLHPEILFAMDIVPLYLEFYQIYMCFFNDAQEFLNISAEHGFPPEVCSSQRATDAMCITGLFPKVDAFIYSNMVCDNVPKSGESMALHYKVPGHFIDRPYKLELPRHKAYYRKELESQIRFLEEVAGRKMDYERLKEVLDISYRTALVSQEINELRKAVPCPMPAEAAWIPSAVNLALSGLPEALAYVEQFRDELKERVANGIGAVPNERFRIVYPYAMPMGDMELMSVMEERYGAVCVADMSIRWGGNGKWLVDPSDPVGNLVEKDRVIYPNCVLPGPLENMVSDNVKMAQEYQADGAIWFAAIGCRHGAGSIRAQKDELEKHLNIPMIAISCDHVDKAFTTREEMLNKLDGFFEMVEDSKQYQTRRKAA